MDIKSLTDRLQTAEAQLAVAQDYQTSLKRVVFQMAQLLHEKGVLKMQDVAKAVESSAAFAQAGFGSPKQVMAQPMAEALRELGDAIDQAHGKSA